MRTLAVLAAALAATAGAAGAQQAPSPTASPPSPPPPYGAPIDRARAENAIASAVAEHKARTAAAFRRPTRAFEEATRGGATVLSLEVVIASAGGVPLVEDGRLIGAIVCCGGANADDETICLAGAATINGSAS